MLNTENHDGNTYKVFGDGKINLVIEMGLGATLGEWWHIAQKLSERCTVLLYERKRVTVPLRTPENIAQELHALLLKLGGDEKITLLAHSQGGLYAQQFIRLYPDAVRGVILIDPLSADDSRYKELMPPDEQKKSGFDKSKNLVIMERFAKMHMGFLIRAVMRKAPPFYYYNGFPPDAADYILTAITKPDIYSSAIDEYRYSHDDDYIGGLKEKNGFPDIPLVLITHSSEFSEKEIAEFGRTTPEFAKKVEDMWQSFMKEYLSFSANSVCIQATNSGHFVHLTEPELIYKALKITAGK